MNRWFTTADENAAPGGMTGLVGAFSLEQGRRKGSRKKVGFLSGLARDTQYGIHNTFYATCNANAVEEECKEICQNVVN